MNYDILMEELNNALLKKDKQLQIAISALWLLDTKKEAQNALKELGVWGVSKNKECSKQ